MAIKSIKNKTRSGSLLMGNAPYDPAATFLIQRVTVGAGGATGISFTSIPSNYKHLQIRYMARITDSVTFNDINVRFNNDSANNYAFHMLRGSGSAVSNIGIGSFNSIQANDVLTGALSTSGIYGVGIIDIHDYASTAKNKTARLFTGNDQNGSAFFGISSGLWMNTSAINRIDITQTFANGSTFALYGMVG
jgi:hypothetical protein